MFWAAGFVLSYSFGRQCDWRLWCVLLSCCCSGFFTIVFLEFAIGQLNILQKVAADCDISYTTHMVDVVKNCTTCNQCVGGQVGRLMLNERSNDAWPCDIISRSLMTGQSFRYFSLLCRTLWNSSSRRSVFLSKFRKAGLFCTSRRKFPNDMKWWSQSNSCSRFAFTRIFRTRRNIFSH